MSYEYDYEQRRIYKEWAAHQIGIEQFRSDATTIAVLKEKQIVGVTVLTPSHPMIVRSTLRRMARGVGSLVTICGWCSHIRSFNSGSSASHRLCRKVTLHPPDSALIWAFGRKGACARRASW